MTEPRKLTGHIVNPANDKLVIEVMDSPGPGGAHHWYQISGFDSLTNRARPYGMSMRTASEVLFQNGAINEVGVNGVTHEALIAILIDRLTAFQIGPYANPFNARALEGLMNAQDALLDRTRSRMKQGIEGTMAVGAETTDKPSQDPLFQESPAKQAINKAGNPIMAYFKYGHLPEGPLRETSAKISLLAEELEQEVKNGAEKSAGLRKLLEAKDCFVRAVLP